eukprot:TRINITY_DN2281_c0_g1_i4.p1 TRINITY_DN2281_c0_g1~~TRINITY_DN2281_c0_g1_i4.p1  ORF type:complete len:150 (+),score=18.13 TRINITY_DN2281_c0_g1_i4:61-510(+)
MDYLWKLLGPMWDSIIRQGLSAEELSLSIAFGITGGLFPIPGVTTFVCFLFVWLFNVNMVVCQVVNLLLTPLQLALTIPIISLGNAFFGVEENVLAIFSLLQTDFFGALAFGGMSILRGIALWAVISPFATFLFHNLVFRVTRYLGKNT